MDTDDLSYETHKAILREAETFDHNLTLQFGLLSGYCNDEEEFLDKSVELFNEIKTYDEVQLETIFLDNLTSREFLYETLDKILLNIEKVRTIHKENRAYD